MGGGFPVVVSDTAEHVALEAGRSSLYIAEQLALLQERNGVVASELCGYALHLGELLGDNELVRKYFATHVVGGGVIVYRMLESQFEADELSCEPDCVVSPVFRAVLEAAFVVEQDRLGDVGRFDGVVELFHGDGSVFRFVGAYAFLWGRWIVVVSRNHRPWCCVVGDLLRYESTTEVRTVG